MPTNRGSGPDLIRVAVVAGLLVIATPALAARGGRSLPGPGDDRSDIVIIAFLGLLAACWLIAYRLGSRALRAYTARWARPLAAATATAAFGVTAVVLMSAPREATQKVTPAYTPPPIPTPTPTPSQTRVTGHEGDSLSMPIGPLLAVAGLLVLVALAVIAMQIRIHRRASGPPDEPAALLTPEALRAAVDAAGYALRLGHGPRDAVIACYGAMERALAGAGAEPRPADTPAEVLARAVRGGLIRGSAAEALTDLFRTARFSRHPITEQDVARAGEALAAVRADLTVREDV